MNSFCLLSNYHFVCQNHKNCVTESEQEISLPLVQVQGRGGMIMGGGMRGMYVPKAGMVASAGQVRG